MLNELNLSPAVRRYLRLDADELLIPPARPATRRRPPTSADPREADAFADPRDRTNAVAADFLARI